MKRLLLSISLLFIVISIFSQELADTACRFIFADGQTSKYSLQIESKHINISSICLMQKKDGQIKGCLVNEFGIKAFDFVYNFDNGKFEMLNIISMLDRGIIKRNISADFKSMLSAEGSFEHKRDLFYKSGSELIFLNKRSKTKYIFAQIIN